MAVKKMQTENSCLPKQTKKKFWNDLPDWAVQADNLH